MNNKRRKEIVEVLNELAAIVSRVEDLQNEEQESYDNMSEGLQQSERGVKSEEAARRLDYALTAFDDIKGALNDAIE